jgi:hypothetical protein
MKFTVVDTETAVRASQFWSAPLDILDKITFFTYGILLAYTSTKSFRNLLPQTLKLSITCLIASLALSFAEWAPNRFLGLPSIWAQFPSNAAREVIYHLWELSPPLFHASILKALSHIRQDGQAMNVGWTFYLAMILIHLQAAMCLPIFVIRNYTDNYMLAFGFPCDSTDMIYRIFDAKRVIMELYDGVRNFTTIFTLTCAISLLGPGALSSTEGVNVSTNLLNHNSKLTRNLYSRCCAASVPGWWLPSSRAMYLQSYSVMSFKVWAHLLPSHLP